MKQDCIFPLHPAGFASCKSTLFFHLLSWWIWMGVGGLPYYTIYEFNSQFPFETCVQGIIVAVLTKTKYRPQWCIQPPWVATGTSHRWKWGFSICLLSFSLHWEDNDTRWDQTLNNVLNHISKWLELRQNCPTACFSTTILSVWKCCKTFMIGIYMYMLDTLQMFKLIQHCILQTWLIPGKLSIFPIIGTLLKKLITTGKNPLKNKIKLHWNINALIP